MKKVFRLEDFKDERYAMHCKTAEEAKEFCNFLHKNGRKWLGGKSYSEETYFDTHKEDTAYVFNQGCFGHLRPMTCTGQPYYDILEFSDFIFPDSEEQQDPKADGGKPRISLVPMQILWDVAEVREYGTKKYKDPDNWKRVEMQRYVDALLRHTLAFVEDPESLDEESGLAHYKHMACNMAFISELMNGKKDC